VAEFISAILYHFNREGSPDLLGFTPRISVVRPFRVVRHEAKASHYISKRQESGGNYIFPVVKELRCVGTPQNDITKRAQRKGLDIHFVTFYNRS